VIAAVGMIVIVDPDAQRPLRVMPRLLEVLDRPNPAAATDAASPSARSRCARTISSPRAPAAITV